MNSKKSLHDSGECFSSKKAHQKTSIHEPQQSKLQMFASTAVPTPNVLQSDKVKMVTMDPSSLHQQEVRGSYSSLPTAG